jgi:hypothetical protein
VVQVFSRDRVWLLVRKQSAPAGRRIGLQDYVCCYFVGCHPLTLRATEHTEQGYNKGTCCYHVRTQSPGALYVRSHQRPTYAEYETGDYRCPNEHSNDQADVPIFFVVQAPALCCDLSISLYSTTVSLWKLVEDRTFFLCDSFRVLEAVQHLFG